MEYNRPTKIMVREAKEIGQIIVNRDEDGKGTVTVIASDGTTKSEQFDSYYSNSQAEATEKATQRVQDA
jgi:hypothetical protein